MHRAVKCWTTRSMVTGEVGLENGFLKCTLEYLLGILSVAMQCKDPRDRIYGLLGLAVDTQELGIVPDYSKTEREVLVDVSSRMMERGTEMVPLAYWTIGGYQNDGFLPSWVSRWPGPELKASSLGAHFASDEWDGPVSFSANRCKFQIQGIQLGRFKK